MSEESKMAWSLGIALFLGFIVAAITAAFLWALIIILVGAVVIFFSLSAFDRKNDTINLKSEQQEEP